MSEVVSIRDLLIGEIVHRIRRDIRDLKRVEGFDFARETVAYILASEAAAAERLPSIRKDTQ